MTPLNSEASAAAMTDAATIIIKELQTIAASLEDLTKRWHPLPRSHLRADASRRPRATGPRR